MLEKNDEVLPIVEFWNVSKRFGDIPVLRHLFFSIEPGDVAILLGRNGEGKTTAIEILLGLLQPDEGEIFLFGQNIRNHLHELKQQIGYVPQSSHFFTWMNSLQLEKFLKGFYKKWDTHYFFRLLQKMGLNPQEKIENFSGGMKAKLSLVCALSYHPLLLVLDEPTANLDPIVRSEFLELVFLEASQKGKTVLFSTHLIDETEKIANKIVLLSQGQVLYYGEKKELLSLVCQVRFRSPPDQIALFEKGFKLLTHSVLQDSSQSCILTLYAPQKNWQILESFPEWIETFELHLNDVFVSLMKKKNAKSILSIGEFR